MEGDDWRTGDDGGGRGGNNGVERGGSGGRRGRQK